MNHPKPKEKIVNTPRFGQPAGFGKSRSTDLFDEGLRAHMLRVYNYMALGLVLSLIHI